MLICYLLCIYAVLLLQVYKSARDGNEQQVREAVRLGGDPNKYKDSSVRLISVISD